MQRLLNFLYRFRTFGLFLILEVFCAWLIIAYNNRYNARFLNSSNTLVASINKFSSNTSSYFKLKEINERLIKENLLLRSQLSAANLSGITLTRDSAISKFDFFDARVINNTYRRAMNFITLDAGSADGVEPGMGVISGSGVVGQVKSVSTHFATVTSLLHRNLMVSSSIKRTNTLCTIQWDGISPLEAELKYVPRHINIKEGDTITTSGYNAVFPRGIMIGTINSFTLAENDVFYKAKIDLAVDFSSLDYVFLVTNELKAEQDSLQNEVEMER